MLTDDECPCPECQGEPCECEPTERQIERMLDAPDAAERQAEMLNVYFDLK